MGPIPVPARSTFPIDTPNHEHGHYDDDEDIDEEATTGDTDVAATWEGGGAYCCYIPTGSHTHAAKPG